MPVHKNKWSILIKHNGNILATENQQAGMCLGGLHGRKIKEYGIFVHIKGR